MKPNVHNIIHRRKTSLSRSHDFLYSPRSKDDTEYHYTPKKGKRGVPFDTFLSTFQYNFRILYNRVGSFIFRILQNQDYSDHNLICLLINTSLIDHEPCLHCAHWAHEFTNEIAKQKKAVWRFSMYFRLRKKRNIDLAFEIRSRLDILKWVAKYWYAHPSMHTYFIHKTSFVTISSLILSSHNLPNISYKEGRDHPVIQNFMYQHPLFNVVDLASYIDMWKILLGSNEVRKGRNKLHNR